MLLVLLILIILLLYGPHLWARSILNRYNREVYFSGNGFDLARLLLRERHLKAVAVEISPVGDHYDPEKKAVRLSNATCGRNTLTAAVVAAHEVGHALQDHDNYPPLAARNRMITAAARMERIGAGIMMAVPLLTLITRIPAAGIVMFAGGLATLGIPVIIHLLTLPTEFNASFKRALPLLVGGRYIPPEDIPAARRILLACALTYVANALVGLLNIWRWIRVLRR
jgi:Zn-dependent membrane protease YugP